MCYSPKVYRSNAQNVERSFDTIRFCKNLLVVGTQLSWKSTWPLTRGSQVRALPYPPWVFDPQSHHLRIDAQDVSLSFKARTLNTDFESFNYHRRLRPNRRAAICGLRKRVYKEAKQNSLIVPSNNGLVRKTFNLEMVSSIIPGKTKLKAVSANII